MTHLAYDSSFLERKGDKLYMKCREQYWQGGEQDDMDYMRTHTTYEIVKYRCQKHPERDCFGYRYKEGKRSVGGYIWLKNNEILTMVDNLASGIQHHYHLKKGSFVGIMSSNRYEWYVSQFALQRHGVVPVPLYSTLGKEAIDYIITTLGIKLVFCTFSEAIVELHKSHPSISFICFDDDAKNQVDSTFEWKSFTSVIKLGKEHPCEPELPTMEDMFAVIFTSGTSGIPKGAVHTFKSANHAAYVINTTHLFQKKEALMNETFFSYLPSAHVLDQQITHCFVYSGARVGFISGGISTIMEDMKLCQPTFLVAVPRVLQKIYDGFVATISKAGCMTRLLFNIAFQSKLEAVKTNSKTLIDWDSWVFSQIHDVLGGKMKYILNGGAPLTEDLYNWLRVCTGANVMQGYGLTESFGGCCCSIPLMTDMNDLNVGSVPPTVEIRLVSVPDMEYTVDDEYPTGEIQIRAPQIFSGYYQNEGATKEAFTDDHFFCTGDIGRICKDGSLCIIDRKKNLFKLAQGEYVPVESLENQYNTHPWISQCFVYGESSDVFVVGVIVLEQKEIPSICKVVGIDPTLSIEEIYQQMNTVTIRKQLLKIIETYMRDLHIPGYQIIKNVYVEHEEFSTKNDLMTPSFKLKRHKLKKRYCDILTKMREEVCQNII